VIIRFFKFGDSVTHLLGLVSPPKRGNPTSEVITQQSHPFLSPPDDGGGE